MIVMVKNNSYLKAIPVLAAFFVMGFCDIVGISSDYMQKNFNWSPTMTGFVPSMVFIWFLFLGIPVGNRMSKYGRKNTVLASMAVTVVGMFLPLLVYSSVTCIIAYVLLGVGNAILQISLNPLLNNVISSPRLLTSSLTAGQVIKAVSSLVGPEIVLFATLHFGDDKWYYCFPILGTITLFFALWLTFTPIRREQVEESKVSFSDSFNLLKNRTILILFFGIFFIVGVDVATNYVSSKLMSIRYDWTAEQVKFATSPYRKMSIMLMILSVVIIISNLYGLYTRNLVVNLVVTVLLLLAGKCIFLRKVDGIALLWKKLFNAGAYLLLLGLCFEPFQDGIKKDPTTFSYFFVTSGLAFLALLFLSIVCDYFRCIKSTRFLVMSGQNPMIAYVVGDLLIMPLANILGIASLLSYFQQNAWLGFLQGAILTSLAVLVTMFFTKIKWFWRT